ncbi:Enoyl-CoA hydratase [Labilithrix luteola]|uniref:Enoyl-CoA hydratase n=1 Tax=Labilithrix luteola TaxID=1391654 RepID=A0A0K1QEM5_9BACT|nr:3-hydroxyacyl-CoA dehydrogenase/enoyl-CoA hydratase family protein [Labilithrix luteola]AKV04188.1 Enoyl-CoA hydratase [Labilithrix luteola]
MHKPIRRTAVIGAGVMGSGIAAHFANAGLEVLLLDIVPPNLTDAEKKDPAKRNGFAAGGLEKAIKARPAAFFHKDNARLVKIGNVEDDLDKLKDCDLVIEAIIEKMEAKQALFEKLEKVVPQHCIVASNTSGLRISEMTKGRSDNFKKHFVVLHFFNPVRYMKLLEIVVGPEADKDVLAHAVRFAEDVLGKGVVFGKDTPNFVGNRIGAHAMMATIHQMIADGLQPEDVDNITGTPMAHPKSASFRTADLVGLDTFAHVADNCYDSLTTDEDRDVFKVPEYIRKMVEKKLLGDKTKGGFFKRGADKQVMTLDPKTLEYRAKGGDEAIKGVTKGLAKVEDPRERVKKLVADQGKAGDFARKVLYRSLAYSARRIGEIADSVVAIDDAMKWGYNWELGPFEVWDALGFAETVDAIEKAGHKLPDSVKKMKASGATGFYKDGKVFDLLKGEYVAQKQDPRYATLQILRRGSAPVLKNDGAEAWDLGDGILGLTFKTKANSIDPDVISMIGQAVDKAESEFRGMVVANEGEHFCVGANLLLVVMAAGAQQWEDIRKMVHGYQGAVQRMKYSRVPVVAAPYGMTLGGGLELCMGAGAVQAAAETYSGLVEVGVGLIPGGAGTMNMLWRSLEGIPEGMHANIYENVTQVFKNIALVKVATSAEEAKALGYFRRTDGVSFDKARLVVEAKNKAIGMASSGYHPPIPRAYRLPGESGIATLSMMVDTLVAGGFASEHDAKIARKLAVVLCGGLGGAAREVTESEMLELEAEAFVSLTGEPKSQERMQFMLMNNKPLRN